MRSAAARLLAVVVLAGCAGTELPPPVAPPPATQPPVDQPPATQPPVDQPPTETPPAATGEPLCKRVAELAAGGEHKPAAEAMAAAAAAGAGCPPEVEAAAADSRRRLAEADALLLAGQGHRRAGDLTAARQSMRAALEIYPDYHWAAKLLGDVEGELGERLEHLKSAATARRQAGDLGGALELLEEAARLEPESAMLAAGLRTRQRQVVEHSLEEARAAEVRRELDEAARLTLLALDTRPAEPELRLRLLEYAERLGMMLFSDGALLRAREIWERALALDEANPKLLEYLEQVQQRLDNLERIRSPG